MVGTVESADAVKNSLNSSLSHISISFYTKDFLFPPVGIKVTKDNLYIVLKITDVEGVKGGFYKVKARTSHRVYNDDIELVINHIKGAPIYLDKTN